MSYEQWKAKLEGAEARIAELEAWQKEAVVVLDFLAGNDLYPDYWGPKAEKLINQAKEQSDE